MLVKAETVDVSSTQIRELLRNHQSVAGLVPPSVERYLLKEKMYV